MKNKNQIPATILLVLGAVLTAGGIFLLVNRFSPMWSFSHKYMTDNAIFVTGVALLSTQFLGQFNYFILTIFAEHRNKLLSKIKN